jgi:glycosyltransferase involved in cell wall biosynthesis
MLLSVVVCTHNPELSRLSRTTESIERQSLASSQWELIVVDNASEVTITPEILFQRSMPFRWQLVREPCVGLTPARIRGIREATGEVIVFVDDDNLLETEYLATVATRFAGNPNLGAVGGKSVPKFDTEPPLWTREFWRMLALRDLGPKPLSANGATSYPGCAPIGAGMAVRRDLALGWSKEIEAYPVRMGLDRSGRSLASGGDNDLMLTILERGFEVEYVPELLLTHIIPSERTTRDYLARLNYASSKTWVQVLRLHGVSLWTPISRLGAITRKLRSFLVTRAWSGPAEYVRWRGACGIFDGRVTPHADKHAQS